MGLINYTVEVGICLAVLYALYFVFLRSTTFHQLNRFVILFSMIASFTVPHIEFKTEAPVPNELQLVEVRKGVEEVTTVVGAPIVAGKKVTGTSMHPYHIFFYAFFAAVIIGLLRYAYSNIKIWILFSRAKISKVNGATIYIIDKDISPFTYFNKILLPLSVFESNSRDAVIAHELTHAKQWHNIDLHLIQILKSFQILNPFIYLYERDLKAIHEYIADSGASSVSESKSDYMNSLLDVTMGANVANLANSFNGIKLIRRITMLQKKRTPSAGILKYTLFIPALLALFFVFSSDSSTNFKRIDHSAYSEPDEYPTLQNKNITQQILSKLNLTDEWAKGEKVAKYCIGYEIDKSGKIIQPYFTNAKFAEDESWKNKSIDAEMEAQILKAINELDLRYTPAIKDDRPVKYFSHFQLIIGDKQKWHTYNASGTVMTKLPYADHRIGYNNPAEKASFGKMGLPVLSHKQCYRIPELIKYPEEAKSEKLDADVELSFEVDNKGYAQDIKIEKSAGELFDQSAVTAIATIGGFRPNQTFNGGKRLPIIIKYEYGTDF